MNLLDLFEKEVTTDPQKIDIEDPKMKYLVNKARTKYAYAKSDLEAFVKFMQDEVEAEKDQINKNKDNIGKEHETNQKQGTEIEHQAQVDAEHEKKLQDLEAKEREIEKQIDRFDAVRQDIEHKIKQLDQSTLDKGQSHL